MHNFWNKVEKTDGCWLWTGALSEKGYGRFGLERKNRGAHRVAYILTCGPIPDGQCVCHRCDNRRCVRPDHLFLGTVADNNEDMRQKGRRATLRPPRPTPKITEDIVRQIRASVLGPRALGRLFGVDEALIRQVRRRTIWAHVE